MRSWADLYAPWADIACPCNIDARVSRGATTRDGWLRVGVGFGDQATFTSATENETRHASATLLNEPAIRREKNLK